MTDHRAELRRKSQQIKERALTLGFDAVGITPATATSHDSIYRNWAQTGMAGEMGYLTREDAVAKRADPGKVVPGVRSVIAVARGYFPGGDPTDEKIGADSANFARYARNEDYHELLRDRLIELQEWISDTVGPATGRSYVDTGPLLERDLANRAGIGWFGRNTMLILPQKGSYYFLGAILLDLHLEYDDPLTEEFCGSCARCISACPTGALLGRTEEGAPLMDAGRCISYLTIELKGAIPRELRPLIGNRVYGCDICQEVCPHNNPKFVQITDEPAFLPREGVQGESLIELMSIDQEEFSARFRRSPVKRAKRRGLLRNVAIALGNWRSVEAVPVLIAALRDTESLVRGHAAWALGRIGSSDSMSALNARLDQETDQWVLEEIRAAISEAGSR